MSKEIIVFIDNDKPASWYNAEHARIFKEAKPAYDWCKQQTHIDTMYLDHDLGEGMTGFEILTKLVEEDRMTIGRVVIISLNAVGIQRIRSFCQYNKIPCKVAQVPKHVIINGQGG